ncbi:sucrose transport protein SUC3 isoform X3 [Ziziphus jujuba]|uniref:Sucrose transport protein SUC3 isoform X3 n=1 Tax=Ziziphus jujuba TaxID=326968 RepID=A0ABM3I1D2_ZIZJJ|nr:sucrose transport protein SUC3 isoform X3 [Ziziphus jujuba]
MAGKTDSVTIRVPYRNLKEAEREVEMVGVEPNHRIELNSPSSSSPGVVPNGNSDLSPQIPPRSKQCSLIYLVLSCTIAAGVQFGWALQLSLLTPYIQTLGIGHAFSSFIWLCGPITGLVVQPCVGIWSDKCTSKYGRRRPFILAGSLLISVSVILIGFSADIGYHLGDTKEHCSTFKGTRTKAAFIFIIGFWLLDLANNTVQGPARALLADLAGPDQRNTANAVFCSWMAVGNILGFSSGASGKWHEWFPFLLSRACCEACGNLKAAFLIAVLFLTLCTLVTIYFADEVPLTLNEAHRLSDSAPLLDDVQQNGLESSRLKPDIAVDSANGRSDINLKHANSKVEDDQNHGFNDGPGAVLVNLLTSLRHLPPAMHSVLIVMALSWLSWFPFFLFDTDWMGREVYHGDPKGSTSEIKAYDQGVREGTAIISLISVKEYSQGIEHVIGGSATIKNASLVVFALLGFPLAITYSVPFSVTAQLTADSGGGQGLAIGVLNLAIVVPQMIVSLGAGPWDALFGGGNIPAFVLASFAALAAGVIAIRRLPNLSSSSFTSSGFHFG